MYGGWGCVWALSEARLAGMTDRGVGTGAVEFVVGLEEESVWNHMKGMDWDCWH